MNFNEEVKKSLEDLKTTFSEKAQALHDEMQKSLKAERETNDELLKAKADGKAFSEVQEKLERLEKATNDYQKACDEEIARLKMQSNATPTEKEEETKSSFFHLLQYGNGAGLDEGQKNRLAEVLSKQSELSEKPLSIERVKAMISGIDTAGGLLVMPPCWNAAS